MSQGVVGREPELVAVDQFLDAAGQGSAALVLEGEAGIGKTTLWREALRRAQERGAQVLSCRPAAAEATFSFAGVTDLLSPLDEAAIVALPVRFRVLTAEGFIGTRPSSCPTRSSEHVTSP